MIFRQLFDSTSSTYTYLLASRHGGEALIIDPVRRLTHNAITDGVRVIERGDKTIGKTLRKLSPF